MYFVGIKYTDRYGDWEDDLGIVSHSALQNSGVSIERFLNDLSMVQKKENMPIEITSILEVKLQKSFPPIRIRKIILQATT